MYLLLFGNKSVKENKRLKIHVEQKFLIKCTLQEETNSPKLTSLTTMINKSVVYEEVR